jgi:dipeptidyl aminopeptidase/acylaminoacyl peptidase
MNSSKTLIVTVGLFLLIGATGCIPGVTWLPDSSGFVYVSEDGQNLVHFNLATKKQQIIVSDEKMKTAWPAMSPNGKSIAVARLNCDKDKGDTLQILIYDLNRKVQKQSKVFSLPRDGKIVGQDRTTTELFWGPPADKIVVSIFSERLTTAIYDVKREELKTLKDSSAFALAGRPARPDGKGFVVTKWKGQECSGISLVDWNGKERPIAMKPPIDDQDKKDMLRWPYMFTSSWQDAKALVATSKGRFEIDTNKLQGKFDSFDSGEPNGENHVHQQFTFAGSQNVVRIVDWTKQVKGMNEQISRLEILDSHQKRIQTLIENALMNLSPSPDGKLVAVRCAHDDKKRGDPKEMIWVIDQSGQVVAKAKTQD